VLVRLQIFDDTAEEVTDVLYSDYVQTSGILLSADSLWNGPRISMLFICDLRSETESTIPDDKFHLDQLRKELTDLDRRSVRKKKITSW